MVQLVRDKCGFDFLGDEEGLPDTRRRKMTKLRHDLMLQIVKLMDAALVTGAVCTVLVPVLRTAVAALRSTNAVTIWLWRCFHVVHHLWARIRCLFDVHAAHFRDRLCAVLGSGGQRFHYVHCDLAAEQASAQHFAGRCGADRAGDFGSHLGHITRTTRISKIFRRRQRL